MAMARTIHERMAAYRLRQRVSGLATLSLIVPAEDAELFRQFAAERRRLKAIAQPARPLRKHWFSMFEANAATASTPDPSRARTAPKPAARRSETLAEDILRQIIRLGWPVGRPLGSEAELMKQHGVSRTVLRQAIRLLEHHAVAHMQRGATGGLVVGRPDLAATVRAVGIYLEYEGIAPRDILETRLILEQATIALAVERLDAEGEARLRADIAAESVLDGTASADALQRLHFTLADLSGDPALRLFAGIVLQISDAHSNFSRRSGDDRDKVVRRIRKLHRDIAESVIARNAAAACMLMERYLVGYRDWME
jgi:DNA-binding FadR family transcriptional regulator